MVSVVGCAKLATTKAKTIAWENQNQQQTLHVPVEVLPAQDLLADGLQFALAPVLPLLAPIHLVQLEPLLFLILLVADLIKLESAYGLVPSALPPTHYPQLVLILPVSFVVESANQPVALTLANPCLLPTRQLATL